MSPSRAKSLERDNDLDAAGDRMLLRPIRGAGNGQVVGHPQLNAGWGSRCECWLVWLLARDLADPGAVTGSGAFRVRRFPGPALPGSAEAARNRRNLVQSKPRRSGPQGSLGLAMILKLRSRH